MRPHHSRESARRDDVPGVNKAVQMPRRLLDGVAHLIVAVDVEGVRHQVQRVLVVLDLGVKARQVEAVHDVVLVDLAKVFVAAGGEELRARPRAQG